MIIDESTLGAVRKDGEHWTSVIDSPQDMGMSKVAVAVSF
jgi:hypothetical protein